MKTPFVYNGGSHATIVRGKDKGELVHSGKSDV